MNWNSLWQVRQRKIRRWGGDVNRSRLFVIVAGIFFGMVVLGLVGSLALFAYFAKDLPSPEGVDRREGFATRIFDRNGKLLYDVYENQKRTPVSLADVPIQLQKATISIEDKNFYNEGGISQNGMIRMATMQPSRNKR